MGSTVIEEQREQMRGHLHGMWAAVAPGWEAHAAYVDGRASALTATLLDRVAPRPGERVLELACGAGGTGLAAAERVGAAGEVVLSDVAAPMVAIAAARAAGAGNVTTKVLDLEAIDESDASYDVVLCRDGLMFALEPERAAAEIRRVLRPGGRAGIVVWAERAANPWLGIVMDAVTAELGVPVPPPGVPGPFALGDPGRLAEVLAAGGFPDAVVEEVAVPLCAGAPAEWWGRVTDLAGPMSRLLAGLDEPVRASIGARAEALVAPYRSADGTVELPGVALVSSATNTAG